MWIFLFLAMQAEATMRVAVVDSGLNLNDRNYKDKLCPNGHKSFNGSGITDVIGHGTNVVSLIVSEAGDEADYCLLIYKYYPARNGSEYRDALKEAALADVSIVNFSSTGEEPDEVERLIIKTTPQTLFVVAAGNEGEFLSEDGYCSYPTCYKLFNVLSVGSITSEGYIAQTSNKGPFVGAWEVASPAQCLDIRGNSVLCYGTSMAAAIHTGKLIKAQAPRLRVQRFDRPNR